MSRYIDADALLHDLCTSSYPQDVDTGKAYYIFKKELKNAPTVDAVEVVRCRDCKHKRMVMKSGCLGCDIQCCLHPYDWYCPEGEKVTE